MNTRVPSPYPIRNTQQTQRNQIIHEQSPQEQIISQLSQQQLQNPERNLCIPQLDIQNPHQNLGQQQIISQPHQVAFQNIYEICICPN